MQWLGEEHCDMVAPSSVGKIVRYWESTGLLRAFVQSYQVEAVAREEELFPGTPRERRGLDDDAPDTDAAPATEILVRLLMIQEISRCARATELCAKNVRLRVTPPW